jgi:DNA-binding NarL/FixJ family response regulator
LARWLLEQSGELGLEALLVRADSLINDAGAHIASGDVVLMILHREPSEWELEEVAVPWERLSQVAGAIAERGAVLILVAAGAQVAEVAACMARGAHAVVEVYNAVDAIRLVPDLLRGTLTGTGLRAALPCPFAEEPLERLSRLTSIELRVLFDLTKGYQADRIATVEWMSLSTVRAHIRSIFRKLGVNSQLAAVALANGTAALDVSLEGEHEPETVASRA